jgi:Domain of unknown function (DUF222)/HNH endonuclease
MDDVTDHSGRSPRDTLAPELSVLSDDQLTVGYDDVVAASRKAEWDRLAFESEIDRRQMYRTDGTASLREWIAIRTSEGDRAASHHATLAHTLPAYPALSQALADGELSADHVRFLLRLAQLTHTDHTELVDLGRTHTVTQLENACRAARRLSRPDDQEADRRRYLSWTRDDNGTFRLSGRLHGVDGITVTNLLGAMAQTAPADPATGLLDPFETRCADALVDVCAGDQHPTPEVIIHIPIEALRPDPRDRDDTEPRPGDHDHGDDHDLGSDGDGDHGHHGDGPLGWEWDQDRRDTDPYGLDPAPGGQSPMTWDGTILSNPTLRRLLCDSRLRIVLDDPDGRPVGIGRLSRAIPGWLNQQLQWRDQSCRFPGCEHTRWLHAHHITHWPDGGHTNLENLTLLCSAHHRLLHRSPWRITGNPDGELTFTSPNGQTHTTTPAVHPANLRSKRRQRHQTRPDPTPRPP